MHKKHIDFIRKSWILYPASVILIPDIIILDQLYLGNIPDDYWSGESS
jgi:hypothetical protein